MMRYARTIREFIPALFKAIEISSFAYCRHYFARVRKRCDLQAPAKAPAKLRSVAQS